MKEYILDAILGFAGAGFLYFATGNWKLATAALCFSLAWTYKGIGDE